MQDAWRAYLGLAMGLTEAPRKKAQEVVRRAVGSGGATAAQLQALAEELVSTGLANREALTKLVRLEVDRALGAVGLATADEVAELTRRVRDLERQLRDARTAPPPHGPGAAPSGGPATAPAVPKAAEPAAPPAPAAVPTKAVAKKAVAKKAIARKPPATVSRTGGAGTAAEPARPVKKAPGRGQQPGGAA
ncbi:phasin family protein [Micromonospora sp. NPDC048830]|uniref:phasin family protein n=1 Tax=Micromonospora sp. NPDC048830 TaxID=3364257 RepID=UPI00371D7B95